MADYKKMYEDATAKIAEASKARVEAAIGILTEFLAEKGLEVGKPCRIDYGTADKAQSVMGVFNILPTEDSAQLKFMPYKKDGHLSKNPKVFCFGRLPDMVWDSSVSGIISVVPCDAPPIITEINSEGD